MSTCQATTLQASNRAIRNVVITGLGGSGIGGSIAADLVSGQASVPITINKDYGLPGLVDSSTLVIACSYSGNTEETLYALGIAEAKNAQIACISSGGQLKARAEEKGYNCLSMQGDNPPRSMLGYSLVYLLHYLEFYGICPREYTARVTEAVALLNSQQADIQKNSEALAQSLKGRIVQILSVSGTGAIGVRWRQQLNENAKMLCWAAEIPEMNHNELVGWEGGDKRFAALFLRNEDDPARNQKRIEIIQKIIGEKTDRTEEVWSQGPNPIARAMYLIHFGDWLSYYLSELNQVDIMDIKSIDHLKSELAKLPQ